MKRDMDLVRKILFRMEEDLKSSSSGEIKIDGYSQQQINYHLKIMVQADLLHVEVFKHASQKAPKSAIPAVKVATNALSYYSISWNGHEFLDAARDNKRWEMAKSAMGKAGGFAIDIMKQLLLQYLKAELKLP